MREVAIPDLAQRLAAFVEVLHCIGRVAASGDAGLDSASVGVVEEGGLDAWIAALIAALADLAQPVAGIPGVDGFVVGVLGVLFVGEVAVGVVAVASSEY